MYADSIDIHNHRASKSHTGVYLASRVSECLHEYGIHGKVSTLISIVLFNFIYTHRNNQILALTADNASNNNPLVVELSELLNGFQGSLTRIRCFAHILNLVVKVYKAFVTERGFCSSYT
jgi:hypothetical protein